MSYFEAYDFHEKERKDNQIYLQEANDFLNGVYEHIDKVVQELAAKIDKTEDITDSDIFHNEFCLSKEQINSLKKVFEYDKHLNKPFLEHHENNVYHQELLKERIDYETDRLIKISDMFTKIVNTKYPFFFKGKVISQLKKELYDMKYEVQDGHKTSEKLKDDNFYQNYLLEREKYIESITENSSRNDQKQFILYTLQTFFLLKESIQFFFSHHFSMIDMRKEKESNLERVLYCIKESQRLMDSFLNCSTDFFDMTLNSLSRQNYENSKSIGEALAQFE